MDVTVHQGLPHHNMVVAEMVVGVVHHSNRTKSICSIREVVEEETVTVVVEEIDTVVGVVETVVVVVDGNGEEAVETVGNVVEEEDMAIEIGDVVDDTMIVVGVAAGVDTVIEVVEVDTVVAGDMVVVGDDRFGKIIAYNTTAVL